MYLLKGKERKAWWREKKRGKTLTNLRRNNNNNNNTRKVRENNDVIGNGSSRWCSTLPPLWPSHGGKERKPTNFTSSSSVYIYFYLLDYSTLLYFTRTWERHLLLPLQHQHSLPTLLPLLLVSVLNNKPPTLRRYLLFCWAP